MSKLIAVVDSGSANLNSIHKALAVVFLQAVITDDPGTIARADGVLFPGVGAFGHAMELLRQKSLVSVMLDCIEKGKPFLGICLGLQLLFSSSEETGNPAGPLPEGLNVIPGQVRRFPAGLPVPHVGWNQVKLERPHPLFNGLNDSAYFYFTHSFYVNPASPGHILALTDYGTPFTSAAGFKNLMGVQFHPEKSGPAGLRLLSNFGNIVADPTLLSAD